jgi:hypothetical protein
MKNNKLVTYIVILWKEEADGGADAFSRKQMMPHAGGYQEEAAQRKLGFLKKRWRVDFLKQ